MLQTKARTVASTSPVFVSLTLFNLRRVLSDWMTFAFSIVLPVFFYLLFGTLLVADSGNLPGGNVAAFIMVGMAVYGGVTATVAHAGMTVVENRSGWGRQLALTPLNTGTILAAHALVILVRAILPVAAVFLAGALTGAEMPASRWALSFVLAVLVCLPFGFYGLVWQMLIPGETTVSIASTSVVLLAFAGNTLMPLTEGLLDLARFSPMYGATALARYPISEGIQAVSGAPGAVTDPLWIAVVNIGAWTVILVGACVALSRRDKNR